MNKELKYKYNKRVEHAEIAEQLVRTISGPRIWSAMTEIINEKAKKNPDDYKDEKKMEARLQQLKGEMNTETREGYTKGGKKSRKPTRGKKIRKTRNTKRRKRH